MVSVIFFTLFSSAYSATPALDPTSPAPRTATGENEIQVTLFGQPCAMTGPVDKRTLELLHSISPEKIRPDFTAAEMEKMRTLAAKATGLDANMSLYRDHLVKRLAARAAFESALKQLKTKRGKTMSPDVLLQNVKEHISPLRYDDFKARVNAAFKENKGAALGDAFAQKLRDEYDAFIQPDTEEEFHKMIKTAQVRYECHFGEEADTEDE